MGIAGGPKIVSDDLVLSLDSCLAASYPGDPVTNIYGDISSSSSLRPSRTEYNTDASWRSVAGVPMCPDPTIGRIYKHTSGSLTSSWSGNSYGYTLKDLTTDSSSTYILTCWVYVSEDSNLTALPCSIEQASSTANVTNYPQYYEMDRKGTWQLLAKKCVADAQVRFIPIYPQRNGVTDGSFSGFYLWGGASVVKADYVTPYVLSSRSATDAFKDLTKNANDGDLVGDTSTGTSSYRDGSVIYTGNMFAGDNATLTRSFNYLDFDGTDDKVTINNSTSLQSAFQSSTFTVECVFKADSSQDNPYPRIHQKGSALIHLTQTSPFGIYHNVHDNSSNLTQAGASGFVSADQWVHVTAVWEGDASSNRNRIYKNGELFTQATGSASGNGQTSTGDLYLGATSDSSRDLNGQIAFFRVYSRVLTAKEIQSNFNALRGRFGI